MEANIYELSNEARDYLVNQRKISDFTLAAFRVGCNQRGEIAVPFYDENDELQLVKNRHPTGEMLHRKRKNEDEVEWTEYEVKTDSVKGGKPILLGSHLAVGQKNLYICYGDYDCMSLYEAGIHAGVSLPFGDRGTSWIDKQWEFLESFEKIIFCPDYDDDKKTQEVLITKLHEIAARLGKYRCHIIPEENFRGLKDVNELFCNTTLPEFQKLMTTPIHVPEVGLIRLADYKAVELREGTPLGLSALDKAMGGAAGGMTTVISGDNNVGKSTKILNLMANFAAEGEKSFFWSGEQKPDRMRWWLEQILAGPNYIKSSISARTGREYFFADPKLVPMIRAWYADLIYVYDKRGIEPMQFFEVAELAVRRYGVTKIFIDNLMAFTGSSDDYLAAQGDFAESCHNFAEDWNCHVFLVAHNKKTLNEIPNKDDVEGSKKITNWADFVMQLVRLHEGNRKETHGEATGITSLCKNRETGDLVDVRTYIESKSKRIVQLSEKDSRINKTYGWEKYLEYELQ